jgi:TRAP-type C4-dicarboxylate transport system permease small subunit
MSQRRGPIFYVGATALLAAMGIDTLAVIGRHSGVSLLGSIELVQAAMLLASSAALVAATLQRQHASVHLLIDRLPPRLRRVAAVFGLLLSGVFFLCLAGGSMWIASDMWGAREASDLLKIPYAPLRLASIVSLLTVAAALAIQLRRELLS